MRINRYVVRLSRYKVRICRYALQIYRYTVHISVNVVLICRYVTAILFGGILPFSDMLIRVSGTNMFQIYQANQ